MGQLRQLYQEKIITVSELEAIADRHGKKFYLSNWVYNDKYPKVVASDIQALIDSKTALSDIADNAVDLPNDEPVEVIADDVILERLKICISICESGVLNTSLKPLCITPYRLANKLKQVMVGSKDGSYFVRYNGTIRNDKAAPDTADILILDGDSRITSDGEIAAPAPDPALVSEILAKQDVPHVIYSSYSNGEKGEDYFKYRVIIFIRYNREQLPVLLNHFHELLHDEGCLLFNVKENRSFSQPWFFPRCPAERLHLFKFYEFLDGNEQDANAICSAYEAAHPTIQPEPIYRPAPVKNDYTGLKISPIQLFNEHWKSPVYYLQSQGYRYFGSRLLPPHCRDSSIAGVQVCSRCIDGIERVYSHHGNDPLADGSPHDSFDCFKIIEHNNNEESALIAVGRSFMVNGMTLEKYNQMQYAKGTATTSVNWSAFEVAA